MAFSRSITLVFSVLAAAMLFNSHSLCAQNTSSQIAAPSCLKIESASSAALKQFKGVRWAGPNRLAINQAYKAKRIGKNRIRVMAATSNKSEDISGEFHCGCEASGGSCGASGSGTGCNVGLSGNHIQCIESVCETCELYFVANDPERN